MRSATSFLQGYVNCFEFLRKETPKEIEVTEELYEAYKNELLENVRYIENLPVKKEPFLYYRSVKIKKGFSGWNARGLSA